MRIRRVSRSELTGSLDYPATFRIVSRARVATCTRSEDGGLAGFESSWRDEEDKLETSGGGSNGGHAEVRTKLGFNQAPDATKDSYLKLVGTPNLDYFGTIRYRAEWSRYRKIGLF
jgi:hypothetical protein